MPAILVASKMKSGLPKPVHSAAPILHVPPARTGPQPCYLKLGSKVEVSKTAYTSQIPLKSQGLQEPTGEGLPLRKSSSLENGFDTQLMEKKLPTVPLLKTHCQINRFKSEGEVVVAMVSLHSNRVLTKRVHHFTPPFLHQNLKIAFNIKHMVVG
ncbi:neuron navigator 2-like isoform 1 [Cricetulus griseus]|uniref:Neuron navigator 2-like isoform 1 n=1 Tax=Cricetulus griseus TaxID=10029 RepID=A0A061I7G0_CRIGR|nr:neuron navigator 2-like isoform 1 [Cricetulus griseus]